MNKLFKISAAVLLLGMVSCAKDYSCECDIKHEQSGLGYSETKEWNQSTSMTGKEDEMKQACADMSINESYTDGAGYTQKIESDCSLR